MGASSSISEHAEGVKIMTYMRKEEVEPWSNTQNIVSQEKGRGEEYEKFKREKARKLFDLVEKRGNGFKNAIQSYTVATFLTYRDYIGTVDGAIYGIAKDCHDPLKTIISPHTKIDNLFITSQNMALHVVCGVSVGAFTPLLPTTCTNYWLKKIREVNR